MKLTAEEVKAVEELRAKQTAERSKDHANDMRNRLQEQIQRIVRRVETHSHFKVASVAVDCANDYATVVKLEGE